MHLWVQDCLPSQQCLDDPLCKERYKECLFMGCLVNDPG